MQGMQKMLFILLGMGLLLSSSCAFALLPPYYQSAKEIIAILNNNEIAEKMGSGRLIQAITKIENGYLLKAGQCQLKVVIKYSPQPEGRVGPAIFEIYPGNVECF